MLDFLLEHLNIIIPAVIFLWLSFGTSTWAEFFGGIPQIALMICTGIAYPRWAALVSTISICVMFSIIGEDCLFIILPIFAIIRLSQLINNKPVETGF